VACLPLVGSDGLLGSRPCRHDPCCSALTLSPAWWCWDIRPACPYHVGPWHAPLRFLFVHRDGEVKCQLFVPDKPHPLWHVDDLHEQLTLKHEEEPEGIEPQSFLSRRLAFAWWNRYLTDTGPVVHTSKKPDKSLVMGVKDVFVMGVGSSLGKPPGKISLQEALQPGFLTPFMFQTRRCALENGLLEPFITVLLPPRLMVRKSPLSVNNWWWTPLADHPFGFPVPRFAALMEAELAWCMTDAGDGDGDECYRSRLGVVLRVRLQGRRRDHLATQQIQLVYVLSAEPVCSVGLHTFLQPTEVVCSQAMALAHTHEFLVGAGLLSPLWTLHKLRRLSVNSLIQLYWKSYTHIMLSEVVTIVAEPRPEVFLALLGALFSSLWYLRGCETGGLPGMFLPPRKTADMERLVWTTAWRGVCCLTWSLRRLVDHARLRGPADDANLRYFSGKSDISRFAEPLAFRDQPCEAVQGHQAEARQRFEHYLMKLGRLDMNFQERKHTLASLVLARSRLSIPSMAKGEDEPERKDMDVDDAEPEDAAKVVQQMIDETAVQTGLGNTQEQPDADIASPTQELCYSAPDLAAFLASQRIMTIDQRAWLVTLFRESPAHRWRNLMEEKRRQSEMVHGRWVIFQHLVRQAVTAFAILQTFPRVWPRVRVRCLSAVKAQSMSMCAL